MLAQACELHPWGQRIALLTAREFARASSLSVMKLGRVVVTETTTVFEVGDVGIAAEEAIDL